MRRFHLVRDEDVTGLSGTGIVAEGVLFDTGTAVMRWTTQPYSSLVIWHAADGGIEGLQAIHGHGSRTRIAWLDPA
jgi:hypothetical protein